MANTHQKVIDADFTSVWDGGTTVTTGCHVDLDSGEVFDIRPSTAPADGLYELEDEYISFCGHTYSISGENHAGCGVRYPGGFWYKKTEG